jgi:hypothetical protein
MSTPETDTPETDGHLRRNTGNGSEWVRADFARNLERQNTKLRDIAEMAIHYLSQSYRNGFEDEVKELRAELDQLNEEASK